MGCLAWPCSMSGRQLRLRKCAAFARETTEAKLFVYDNFKQRCFEAFRPPPGSDRAPPGGATWARPAGRASFFVALRRLC